MSTCGGDVEERVGVVIPVYNTGGLAVEAAISAEAALGGQHNVVVVDADVSWVAGWAPSHALNHSPA